jgi:hypothetical protein
MGSPAFLGSIRMRISSNGMRIGRARRWLARVRRAFRRGGSDPGASSRIGAASLPGLQQLRRSFTDPSDPVRRGSP